MSSLSGLGLTGGAALGVEQPAESRQTIEIVKTDGELRVQEPGGAQSHLLEDQHCKPCVSAFDFLKQQYEAGRDKDGLFELAVEQTNRSQRVLGTVAKPGAGPLEGLTSTGGIRATESATSPGRMRPDSVQLSSRARIGRQNGPVLEMAKSAQLELGKQTSERQSGSAQSSSAAPSGSSHSENDGHGHGETVASNDSGIQSKNTRQSGGGQTTDEDGHGSEKNGGTKHAGHDEALSAEEQQRVAELAQRDAEVRAHEQAHKSAAGGHGGAISLSYQTGPDGKRYAVAGEVPVDISPIKGDPSATIQKMQTIQRAALAPAEPSSADRRVAARAAQYANQARVELQLEQREKSAPAKVNKASSAKSQAGDETSNGEVATASEPTSGVGLNEGESAAVPPAQASIDAVAGSAATGSPAVLEDMVSAGSASASMKQPGEGESSSSAGRLRSEPESDKKLGAPNEAAATYGRQGAGVAAVSQPARLSVFG